MRVLMALALLAGGPALARYAEVYEVRTATFPSNPENDARASWERDTLTLAAGFGPTGDWGYGVIGARMNVPAVLENAVAGVVVHYHTPGGYLKRVLYEVGPPAPKRDDFTPVWGMAALPYGAVDLARLAA